MTGTTIPAILTILALIAALAAYRGIRRGGARYYTLEREALLRRASFTLLGSVLLFLAAIALLMLGQTEDTAPGATEGQVSTSPEAEAPAAAQTPDPALESFPPTPTATATVDPNVPTPTPTPVICRAVVDGTAGSGLTLRESPGGPEIAVLPDGTILTLLESEPVDSGGFRWRNVRTVARDEGWVVEEFLQIGNCQ
ncbi:MAG: hypothetical protein R3300_09940 [Candidatus Promineifilaceae bacterium]|nr:hypothetical protein [Candidatus Promineifilaceae bacterium]